MKICPKCKCKFDDSTNFCPTHGVKLIDDFAGKIISGRYKIIDLIGEGGMGRVYKAEQDIGPEVKIRAIKILKPEFTRNDPKMVERFNREAGWMARLEGTPNNVQVIEMGEEQDLGVLFIVMEYLSGRTLRNIMDEEGILSIMKICEIFIQICNGISEAHKIGIVHRDLKPQNIIVEEKSDGNLNVKVMDYGIAKNVIEGGKTTLDSSTNEFVGTFLYASPEHFDKKNLCTASDVFSLGIILYEMLTKKHPFGIDTNTPITTIIKMLDKGEIIPLSEASPSIDEKIPEYFWNIIKKCLKSNLNDRYIDASELYKDMQKLYKEICKGKKNKKWIRIIIYVIIYIILIVLGFFVSKMVLLKI